MALTRRDVLKAGVWSASAAALAHMGARLGVGRLGAQSPAMTAATRRAAGFPVASSQFHGDSSVGAALKSGRITAGSVLDTVQRSLLEPPGGPRFTFDRDGEIPDLRPGRIAPVMRSSEAFLRARFPNLRRHFVFEYYAWYRANPWRHWDEAGHTPPTSIASSTMPALGAYDSTSAQVIEQHARWMADAGVGTIALSWWGQGSSDDQVTHLIMDIMRAHDIHVTFHLEPYRDDRVNSYASDVLYLLREYGDKRRWDNFLLLERADGSAAPVFKSFRTILPQSIIDCKGVRREVPDYAPDDAWRAQTDALREAIRPDFDHVTLLADSLDMGRTKASGFDGIAIYDSYVRPHTWAAAADTFGGNDLLYSFSLNCGFDGYLPVIPRGECDVPLPFEPPIGTVNWLSDSSRLAAEQASHNRILESLRETMRLQADLDRFNARSGFFLTYVNTFNEWHEGTSFEPARHRRDLTPAERALGYHNPDDGAWRLNVLQSLLVPITRDR